MAHRVARGSLAALTIAALCCFAGNSLLARAALRAGEIDAAAYTLIRLASGAAVLFALLRLRRAKPARAGGSAAVEGVPPRGGTKPARAWGSAAVEEVPPLGRAKVARSGSWASAAALFLYAGPFSFAYLRLPAGTGALLLFGAVQVTMIGRGIAAGERPRPLEWLGLIAALGGLTWLVLPGLAAPEPLSAALMLGAGAAWGWYSLRGRAAVDPLATTADNFARAVPVAALCALPFVRGMHASALGAWLAVASGALASGVGYSLWYAALPSLSRLRAGLVQLSVPVLAAASGALLLGEALTWRLAIAAFAIVGGIALALLGRR
ncbi:MAG TPA: DMT family transporter [Myxococcaceae bacterium]|nr:DMT family transporter [Myxococcaceae bacterium]